MKSHKNSGHSSNIWHGRWPKNSSNLGLAGCYLQMWKNCRILWRKTSEKKAETLSQKHKNWKEISKNHEARTPNRRPTKKWPHVPNPKSQACQLPLSSLNKVQFGKRHSPQVQNELRKLSIEKIPLPWRLGNWRSNMIYCSFHPFGNCGISLLHLFYVKLKNR